MDDIVIILLTLVFAVVAAVNQSKNKKRAARQGPEMSPDLPDVFFGERVTEPTLKQAPSVREVAIPREQFLKKAQKFRENFVAVETTEEGQRNDVVLEVSSKKSREITEPDEPGLVEKFSLNDAVIYSEILHPKYF